MVANREQSPSVIRDHLHACAGIEGEIGDVMTTQSSGPTVLVLLGVLALWST